jgi:hypothetical protein
VASRPVDKSFKTTKVFAYKRKGFCLEPQGLLLGAKKLFACKQKYKARHSLTGLTANSGEKFGSLRGKNWQISARNLRSNPGKFTNPLNSITYKNSAKRPVLSNIFTGFYLCRYPQKGK